MKVTTKDCKQFIVREIRKNPNIIHNIWRDTNTAIHEALVEKNWVRTSKYKALEDDITFYSIDGIVVSNVAVFRDFCLMPSKFDTTVQFRILEDVEGKLIFGEYLGD